MATITSAGSGNFSAGATWVGGVVPAAADIAVAATGHTVAIDTDVTVLSFQQAGTGKFTLAGGRTVSGNVIANSGTFTSGGTVQVTATTGTTATLNGNVTGVSTTTSNTAGVVVAGVGSLILNGTVTGSNGNNSSDALGSAGVYTNVTCTITINGAVTVGTGAYKFGFHSGASSNGTFAITGNVTGGGNTSAHGVYMTGTSATLTIAGNVTGGSGGGTNPYGVYMTGASSSLTITGNVMGGSTAASYGVYTTGTSSTLTIVGNVTGGGTGGTNSYAVYTIGASSSLTITGNVTGGSVASSIGVYTTGASSSLAITGNVIGGSISGAYGVLTAGNSISRINSIIGTCTGTTAPGSAGSHAVYDTNNLGGWTVVGGSLIDSAQGDCAVNTRRFRCIPTLNTVRQHANNTGYPNGGMITYGSLDYIPNNIPSQSNVRLGTVYGNNSFTGTMAIPNSSLVAWGVPVDATTGSAVLPLADITAAIGAQLTAVGAL